MMLNNMIEQLNRQICEIKLDDFDFDCIFEQSLSQCVSSNIHDALEGEKIIFTIDEKNLLPVDDWNDIGAASSCSMPIKAIHPIADNTMVFAIDSSAIQIARTEEGSLYSVKSGIAISRGGHALMHFKIGPNLFYLSAQTIRNSEIDDRLAKLVLVDSDVAKRMIQLRVERAIQTKLSKYFDRSIFLVDGSLKSSFLEDRNQNIKNIAESCMLQRNSIIGISKNSRFRILQRISSALANIQSPAYIDIDSIMQSLVRNTIGNHLMVKFGDNNSHVLRADIVTPNYNEDESLGKLLGNDLISQGYPETLRLVHYISTFTNTEISCVKGHVLSNYNVIELASKDIRKTLLGSIPI
jgi:hypothetical protein